MLEKLLGSKSAENVLMYLHIYNEGYPTEISRVFTISLNMVQKQLSKFEDGGILVSQLKGKVRIYQWNPRYPFLDEIRNLLAKNFEYLPEPIKERYYRHRTRPRRKGKK